MKVLFAVDGSSGSFEALDQVAPLLRSGEDQIAIYYAPPGVRMPFSQANPELLARARHTLAEALFNEVRQRLPAAMRASVQTIVGGQDPRHEIVREAEQWQAEMIVVGARGLGPLQRLLLGSVSRAIVRDAKVPVWVARTRKTTPGGALKLMLTGESPDSARPAAEFVGQLAWPADTECCTLSVVMPMFVGQVPDWLKNQTRSAEVEAMARVWTHEHEKEVREAQSEMQQFVGKRPPPLQSARSLVAEGQPAVKILATAAQENVDVIVVGALGKGPLTKLLGSTCETVLNCAECSVLVVPQPH